MKISSSISAKIQLALKRRGTVTIEFAVVGTLLLVLMISLLQLAGTIRLYNSLSVTARQAARTAIVHGSQAAPEKPVWGPGQISQNANGNHQIMSVIRKHLKGTAPGNVQVEVTWPDGTNKPGNRVSVQLTVNNAQLPRLIRWMSPTTLRARSTMQISH